MWISGKPPSEEVCDLLRGHGITPDDEPEPGADEEDIPAPSPGTGVMADVARHIETAYRDLDLDLLGSLLHPQVRWTGLCEDRAQVLDWYGGRGRRDRPTVEGVEVDRDAVLLSLGVARQAEGARPAPPERLYQVFTVEDEAGGGDTRLPRPGERAHPSQLARKRSCGDLVSAMTGGPKVSI